MKLWGADHVLVGSDYPWDMGMYDPCGFVDGCDFLKDAGEMKIMGLNAAKLLRITSRLRSMGIRAPGARAHYETAREEARTALRDRTRVHDTGRRQEYPRGQRGHGPRNHTREGAMARVTGLGHVGIYVRDLERMVVFYRDVMGMRITKQNWRVGIVFLSADPEAVDHEIALIRGRPGAEDPHLINQISMRVASLDDLRVFHRRLVAEGYRIDCVVNHASAIGCYFFDPEGNRTEVFWVTGRPCWVPTSNPIDIEQPDEALLAEVDRVWMELRHVPVGGRMTDETATLERA